MKDKIVSILIKTKQEYISGQEIADILNVSRNSVWKNINTLIKEGFDITVYKNKGYSLKDKNSINKYIINDLLKDDLFKTEIEHFKTIGSTNEYLKNTSNPKEGMLSIADLQTNGKGRRGREFLSPKNDGLYFSFLLKPDIKLKDIVFITMLTGVSVVNAVKKLTGISLDIKWVNDILHKDKKLCGILTEASIEVENQGIERVIVGIGLNLIQNDVIKDNKDINAIALNEIVKEEVNRNDLISEILNHFSKYYKELLLNQSYKEIVYLYKSNLNLINKTVLVKGPNYIYEAKVVDVSTSGKLIVQNDKGIVLELLSEEISMKGKVINEN